MFKVNNKDTKTIPMASFWCLVNFEHVIAGWDWYYFGRRSSELAELVNRFPVCFNLFVFLFLLTPCIVVRWLFSLAWSESHLKKIVNMKGCVLLF